MRLEQANHMLSGKLMDAPQMETFFNKSGFSMEEAQRYTQMAANKKGMSYEMNTNQVGEPAVHPINEVKRPGKRDRIRAFFGSSRAKERIQEFQTYQKQKQEMDTKTAHKSMVDLAMKQEKQAMSLTDLMREEEAQKPKRQRPDFKQVRDEFKKRRAAEREQEARMGADVSMKDSTKKGPAKL